MSITILTMIFRLNWIRFSLVNNIKEIIYFVHESTNTKSSISVPWCHQSQPDTCCVTSWGPNQLHHEEKKSYSQTHTKNHTEDTEGSPMQSGTQALSSCSPLCFPPAPSILQVNHTWLLSLVNVITCLSIPTSIWTEWLNSCRGIQGNTLEKKL